MANVRRLNPFTVRKAPDEKGQPIEVVNAPAEVRRNVDLLRESQELVKQFEGEVAQFKEVVLEFSEEEHGRRLATGVARSFKIAGEKSDITFIVSEASAGITEEEARAVEERWGKAAARDLLADDLASIRFNPEVLEANYDAVVKALGVLPREVLGNLFKPMLKKANPGAAKLAQKYASTPAEFRELVGQLKLKNHLR